MYKELKIILAILLFVTVLLNTNVLAKVAKDPYLYLKEVGKSTCSLFRTVRRESITKVKVKGIPKTFSKVKGKIVLLSPTKRSLSGTEAEIFKGNDKSVNLVKVINVEGVNTGSSVSLRGVGESSKGYSFSSSRLGFKNFCIDPKRRRSANFLNYSILSISLAFKDKSISIDADVDSPGLKSIVEKNRATIKGGIETKLGKGRFKLIYTK